MELENFGCVAMDATEMVNVDGGSVAAGIIVIGLGIKLIQIGADLLK